MAQVLPKRAWTATADPSARATLQRRRHAVLMVATPDSSLRNPAARETHFFCASTLALLHFAQKVLETLAGFVRKTFLEATQTGDAVETEVAKVLAQFAPGSDRPRVAPEKDAERPHTALRAGALAVAIVELHQIT